jgi:hypothetical protein
MTTAENDLCNCRNCERLAAITLERYDTTYLQKKDPFTTPDPVIVTKIKRVKVGPTLEQIESLKKVYFHAGRYAEGARDRASTAAHLALVERGEA